MGVANVNYKIDDELHREAKAEAAYRGLTLRQWVERAIQEQVRRDKAEREKRPGKR